ncbi:SDR family oxidoreductase [Jiangella mangrovi]|uniref:3-oxoacyl-[acyl-carrier protein] reductase n=1 Tax=Jiangella mangrovi TaxID=1524084 RepID=A0A7W9LQ36_9ACTN|nr:SDR family oxidoreductase [Jiangella mangrovi]MBB5791847.1 3-oxoacyl-[acyl-carrier protein] reductase [Jiangella mangrovi]
MTTDHNTPRVAIVTGGSRGIGRQTAARLGREGYAVAVTYGGAKDEGEQAAAEVVAAGGQAIAVQADVADEASVAALFDEAERAFGGVDVVVNSAGIMRLAPLAELDLAELDAHLRTNVRGAFVVDQQAVRRVRSGGAIINVTSSLTRFARPGYSAYAASKGAVEAITLILARELRGRDITVNAVAPGPTATALFLDGKPQELIDRMAAEVPLERIAEPSDIADVIAFLAGPARWINGQTLYANGGAI